MNENIFYTTWQVVSDFSASTANATVAIFSDVNDVADYAASASASDTVVSVSSFSSIFAVVDITVSQIYVRIKRSSRYTKIARNIVLAS